MLLLDTHVVLWLALDPEQISAPALSPMAEARRSGGGLAIATTTLWEIALLHAKGRVRFNLSLDEFLAKVEAVYRNYALSRQIILRAVALGPAYPKNPANRQIGGTSLAHGLQLVTADPAIQASGEVPCIW